MKKFDLIINRILYLICGFIGSAMIFILYHRFILLGFIIFSIFVAFLLCIIKDDIDEYKNFFKKVSDREYPFNIYS